jgi:hypothetical protein
MLCVRNSVASCKLQVASCSKNCFLQNNLKNFLPLEDGITIKAASNRISYRQGSANCEADGKRLCTSKKICKDDNTPHGGPVYGDHWVPVRDSYNEWLQIGKKKLILN